MSKRPVRPPATGCALLTVAVGFIFGLGPYLVLELLSIFYPMLEITLGLWALVLGLFALLAVSLVGVAAIVLAHAFQRIDERKRRANWEVDE